MISIKIEDLVCKSLIKLAESESPDRVITIARPEDALPISVVRVDNVLYILDMRAPIVDKVMPSESILNAWHLDFERNRNFLGLADAYREPFDYAEVNEEVCIISNLYSGNFFHWITEEAIRILLMERAGFTGRYVMRGAFVMECMELLGIPRERIMHAPTTPTMFRCGWFATPICAEDILKYPDLFLELREKFLTTAKLTNKSLGDRLWIDRDDKNTVNHGRELINKEEVYPLLERYGFKILDMAQLPVAGQIAAASGASVIGGTHGAGFLHVFFMEPRSRVVECFTPNLINCGIIGVCRLLRHRYSMVVPNNAYGAYPYGMQLKLDCAQLELILQGLD